MRAPEFWDHDGIAGRLLDPLGRLYGLAGQARRRFTRPWTAPVPVVCIGNLTVGGTGKTPLVLAFARRATRLGRHPQILSRGYGGRVRGPLLVDPSKHDAASVGDEPLLLAQAAPTWVGRDRRASARAAGAAGADLLIMDDGFQNPSLHQDLAVLVVDGASGFGNGRVLPAGPLREPVSAGLARAHALVIVGEDRTGVRARLPGDLATIRARLRAVLADDLAGRRAVAFAGIGRPQKFFDTLTEVGVEVVERRVFPDHHPYRPNELSDLLARAAAAEALALTTAKDLVRIPPAQHARFRALDIELVVEPEDALDRLLAATLHSLPITMS